MGFTEILTIVFITLKLTGVIAWSWFYVLLPEIVMVVIYISILLFAISIPSILNWKQWRR